MNAALAKQYFGGGPAVGRRIRMGELGAPSAWLTVVGVVGNLKRTSLYREMSWAEPAVVFRPLSQNPGRSLFARRADRGPCKRTRGDGPAEDRGNRLRHRYPEGGRGNRIDFEGTRLSSLSSVAVRSLRRSGVLLAAVGVYGVLAQFVAGRRNWRCGSRSARSADVSCGWPAAMAERLCSPGSPPELPCRR